ncbi:hypothetical protein GL263_06875 [Streptomyces durbertensis]|uniref:Uncharacterized protein n=1 Tax=Streptomyces durbertensis TaxID=2448886 RepID=A0ABR6ED82_9ACTN|nr:hypothetical protein [Streptomyces durbertensis]MBB1243288.1 hypothetical protein [Streptomyces durbertensis]
MSDDARPPDPDSPGPVRRTPSAVVLALAAALLVLAAPVALWWAVGHQTVNDPDPDHAVPPLEIPPAVESTLGPLALVGTVVTAVLLARWTSQRVLDPVWWSVTGPLLGAGLALALVHRVVTAEVIGANIGAGLAILFGLPCAALLTLVGLGRALYLLVGRP